MGGGDVTWPWQRADPWTVHVGIAAGVTYRLRVHGNGVLEFAHGVTGPWMAMDRADSMDMRLLPTVRWTPPLPEGVRIF